MKKPFLFLFLFSAYIAYSGFVYTRGTIAVSPTCEKKQGAIANGKRLYQQFNCNACHQIYGLGGYLGPDLTTAWSEPGRGEAYIRAMLRSGGSRMPRFNLNEKEINDLAAYFEYIDATATHKVNK